MCVQYGYQYLKHNRDAFSLLLKLSLNMNLRRDPQRYPIGPNFELLRSTLCVSRLKLICRNSSVSRYLRRHRAQILNCTRFSLLFFLSIYEHLHTRYIWMYICTPDWSWTYEARCPAYRCVYSRKARRIDYCCYSHREYILNRKHFAITTRATKCSKGFSEKAPEFQYVQRGTSLSAFWF